MNKREIESWLKEMSQRYDISYADNKEELWKMLDEKVKDTGEPVNDTDCKEVCRYIYETKVLKL